MTDATGYPLQWPLDRPRTPADDRERARFGRRDGYLTQSLTVAAAIDRIMVEVRALTRVGQDWRIDPDAVVVSCDLKRRKADGLPYSNAKEPDDPGAAVYFDLDGEPVVLACDNYTRLADNLAAIAAHMKALRDQERWKVGNLKRAYAGYAALPAPGQATAANWRTVLGVGADADLVECEAAHRKLRSHHPDRGGDPARFNAVNKAIEQARSAAHERQN